jgi:hypothetical protein
MGRHALNFVLKDWKRLWHLAPAHAAGGRSGSALDAQDAKAALSRLLPMAGNLDVLRRLLASEARPHQPVPTDAIGVARGVLRLLESGRYLLIKGPEVKAKANKASAPAEEWVPIESTDWNDEGAPAAPAKESVDIACEHELEEPPVLETAWEIEAPATLACEHEIETP